MATPEAQLARIVADLRTLGVDPVAVWADGPNNQLRVFVKVRSMADWDLVAGLGNGWRLSLARGAAP